MESFFIGWSGPLPPAVVVEAGIMVELPGDVDASNALLGRITASIREAVRLAVEHEDAVASKLCSFHFAYIGDEYTNAVPCAGCGRWITDPGKMDAVGTLGQGERNLNGDLVCSHCILVRGEPGVT